jgi:hypothetical protein
MDKFFGICLSRFGSSILTAALAVIGFRSRHFSPRDKPFLAAIAETTE